jgi:thiol-activated cytolysin
MKTIYKINKQSIQLLILPLLVGITFSCSETDDNSLSENPDEVSINDYILGLNYSPEELLNTQDISGSSVRDEINTESIGSSAPVEGVVTSCERITYDLKTNFSEVSILQPTDGIIYPGASNYFGN